MNELDPTALAQRAGVLIRAAEPEDVEAINRTMNSPLAARGTLQVPYNSVAFRRETYRFGDHHMRFLVAVPLEGDDEPIANLGIERNQRPRRIHQAALGMAVRDDWQARGVGSALMATAMDIADNWWQVRRIHLEVYTDNEPAIALYRKFGFEIEGTLRQDAFRDGEYIDSHVMARLRA